MKAIPMEFEKSCWIHKQIARDGGFAIYQRQKVGSPAPHFECIRIIHQKEKTTEYAHFEEGETYPGSSTWGQNGWTFRTEEEARAKFDSLRLPHVPKRLKKPAARV